MEWANGPFKEYMQKANLVHFVPCGYSSTTDPLEGTWLAACGFGAGTGNINVGRLPEGCDLKKEIDHLQVKWTEETNQNLINWSKELNDRFQEWLKAWFEGAASSDLTGAYLALACNKGDSRTTHMSGATPLEGLSGNVVGAFGAVASDKSSAPFCALRGHFEF